ncbi:MAG TPA: alpha-L-rhamnosidase C-terminal domain-containing protein, partial [Flavisolibacter sp.]|nr:alpha-L-rhamnosidase C-terminal domain-containing protein [Flavisolibacter sp.]
MKKWLAYMKKKYRTAGYIMTKDSYGDWCMPPESPELIHSKDSLRNTDPKLIATAYYYYFLQVMQRFARLSGNANDISAYKAEAAHVKESFNKTFFDGRTVQYSNNTVTANLLPLAFDIVPEKHKEQVFHNIVQRIMVKDSGHISTGVIGTQWLMRWLTKFGRADIAYRLAGNTTYPSWGYMAKNGATTIWELWNGNTANPAMNSQNHVMLLGDLLVWLYENLGGIQSDTTAVAFQKIIMKPSFVRELEYVNASHRSPYGEIESHWKKEATELSWQITVPANAKAVVYFPATSAGGIMENGQPAIKAEGVRFLKMEKGAAVFEVGSGRYSFTIPSSALVKNEN